MQFQKIWKAPVTKNDLIELQFICNTFHTFEQQVPFDKDQKHFLQDRKFPWSSAPLISLLPPTPRHHWADLHCRLIWTILEFYMIGITHYVVFCFFFHSAQCDIHSCCCNASVVWFLPIVEQCFWYECSIIGLSILLLMDLTIVWNLI